MAGVRTVVTPRGREWTVKRRWTLAGHRGTAGRPVGLASRRLGLFGTGLGIEEVGIEHLVLLYIVGLVALGAVGFAIALVIAASILVAVLIAAAVLALGVLGAAGRALLGRPWLVEARSGQEALAWYVLRGYADAGRVVDQLAEAIARGNEDPQAHGAERVVLG